MADLVLVAIMIAFIALCVAYVAWCDRIIGADDASVVSSAATDAAPVGDRPADGEPAAVRA